LPSPRRAQIFGSSQPRGRGPAFAKRSFSGMQTICEPGNQHRMRTIGMELLSSSCPRMQRGRERRLAELYYGWPPHASRHSDGPEHLPPLVDEPAADAQVEQAGGAGGGEFGGGSRPSSSASCCRRVPECLRPSTVPGSLGRSSSDPSFPGPGAGSAGLGASCASHTQAFSDYMHTRRPPSAASYTDLRKKMMADFQEIGGNVPVYNMSAGGPPEERRRAFNKCRAPLLSWWV